MSWGRDIDAHHRVIRELRQEPLAQIARNARDDDCWFCRVHLVAVFLVWGFGLLGWRLCSPWRRRHGRISRGAKVGIVQINIALESLHAIAIALARNCVADLRLYGFHS